MPMKTESGKDCMGKTFFLGMGQGKAGSTWLYQYLVSHPRVKGGCLKEMHTLASPEYFSIAKSVIHMPWYKFEGRTWLREQYTKAWYRVNWDRYFDHFEDCLSTGAQVTGEISPSNQFITADVLQRVKGEFEARNIRTVPIFVMRDPIDRLYSNARYISMRSKDSRYKTDIGNDYEKIFESLLNDTGERKYANYKQTLENLDNVFEGRDISVNFFENLFNKESISSICQILNLKYYPAGFAKKVGASPKGDGLSHATIVNAVQHFKSEYEGVAEYFGWESVNKFWPFSKYLES
jgi:hypothetical protein